MIDRNGPEVSTANNVVTHGEKSAESVKFGTNNTFYFSPSAATDATLRALFEQCTEARQREMIAAEMDRRGLNR